MRIRDIEFRAKRLDNDVWEYGDLISNSASYMPLIKPKFVGVDKRSYEPIAVQPYTIGQFTGLYDKKGCEIYEGDILYEEISGKMVSVVYDAPQFCYADNDFGYKFLNNPHNFIIVGNIFDNPEFINKEFVI